MIVYSKRLLEYHNIITNDLSNFDQYKYININMFDDNYKYSKIKNDIKCILHDIILKLELGTYDDYMIYNHNLNNKKVLMKKSLGPRIISNKTTDMFKFNKLSVRLIQLRYNEMIYDFLV